MSLLMPRPRKNFSAVSLDQAFRDVVRHEVSTQLAPLQRMVNQLQTTSAEVNTLRSLTQRLAPLASLIGGGALPIRRGPGRPPKALVALQGRRRGRRGGSSNGVRAADRLCAVMGCKRPSRTKGYCAAHYQKL